MALTSGAASFREMAAEVRARVAWLTPLLLLTAVLLLGSLAFAIANLDRGAEELPQLPEIGGAPAAAPFGISGSELQLILQLTIGSMFLAAIIGVLFFRTRGEKVLSPWELTGYLLAIGLVVGAVLFYPQFAALIANLTGTGGQTNPPGTPGQGGLGQLPASTAFPILLALVLIVMIAVWLFAFGSRVLPALAGVGRGRPPERERRRLEAASAVRRTLLDLEAGGDFRTAVLACYQRMCSLFATKGVARQEALTPREIEVLALAELGLSQGVVDDLTGLFEEARYSEHEIGPSQRDRAVECLTSIRKELEA